MSNRYPRRSFLKASLTATSLGGASLSGRHSIRPARAGEANAVDDKIQFGPDLEPIVRLIEETPREACAAVLAEQLRRGLPYRRFLAGVFLAAIRKQTSHHSVYLVNSAHQVSLDVPGRQRLLPLFWAVDHLKWQQQGYPTPAVQVLKGSLPAPEKAAAALDEAVRRCDTEGAERAAVSLARTAGARQAFESFWHYGCRDGTLIGHRAISVTSCWRVLETIGWQHAEPVLRFVVKDLHTRNGGADLYYESNVGRADRMLEQLPAAWAGGRMDRGATLELFGLLRRGRSEAACDLAATQLTTGTGAQAIWDALHIGAAELLMVHESSIGMAGRPLHLNTALNALRFAFHASTVSRVRLLILLQATAWVGDFIRTHLGEAQLKEDKPVELAGGDPPAAGARSVDEIFERLPARTFLPNVSGGYTLVDRGVRTEVGRTLYDLLKQQPGADAAFIHQARTWLCSKAAVEAHEFKLPAALFEDYGAVSLEWRPRLLAASAHWLHGKQSPDSLVLQQAGQAIRTIGDS